MVRIKAKEERTKEKILLAVKNGKTLSGISRELGISRQALHESIKKYDMQEELEYYRKMQPLTWVKIEREIDAELKEKGGDWVREEIDRALKKEKNTNWGKEELEEAGKKEEAIALLSKKHEELKNWVQSQGLLIPEDML